ncbi:MAG: hypothetical protein M3R65_09395, partial [Gemmatimonadota bacterium]|nr:hypothetical protein [Gemmatimonadota bacterium]
VQTFRFDSGGAFELAMTVDVDGTYTATGNRLIETVALANTGAMHTDTSTYTISGDSLAVNERAGSAARVLHRAKASTSVGIVGEWAVTVGGGMTAHYTFAADGQMHVRALVGDEKGSYAVHADTLHLTNDHMFQLPATAQFTVVDSVLTLTPLNGKSARRFHRVEARP